jgi:cytochrome c553
MARPRIVPVAARRNGSVRDGDSMNDSQSARRGGASHARRRARALAWAAIAALGTLAAARAAGDEPRIRDIVEKVCAACHGVDGNSTVPAFPKLAGRHPEYIAFELREFRSGRRRSDVMAPVVAALDPADFAAIGAYFGARKPVPGAVGDPRAAEAGRKLYAEGNEASGVPACGGCHEEDASGGKRFPRLAGQHREYLVDQMEKFRSGARGGPAASPMRAIARRMTDEEIRAVSEFLAGL